MADKQIIPYGADLNKKPNALALTVVPPEVTPICSSQSYYAQAVHQPLIAPLPPRLCLEGKPLQQEPKLDVQKLFKMTKEINLLPLKDQEVLTGLKTNKFGEVSCAKYTRAMPRVVFDGVRAAPG